MNTIKSHPRVLSRRTVLGAIGAASVLPASSLSAPVWAAPADLTRHDVEALIRSRFICDDPALWGLALDAYQFCVLGHIKPAEPPFKHAWLIPGGHYFGQWIWDTMFVADLLSVLPSQRDVIRGVFQNYWDFQRRWKAVKPAYANGFIPNYIAPDSGPAPMTGKNWQTFPAFSQAPLLGWGMERVFRRNNDMELLHTGIGPLEEYHDWYWRERDLNGTGLVCVGAYSGDVQHARFETYDYEVDLDNLAMTRHPTRTGPGEGNWYGDICIPANTAYLLQSEASLIRLAKVCGDTAMAARREVYLARGIAGMRQHMWNQEQGCFLAVRRDSLQQISAATVGGFVPLMAGIPTQEQSARMAEVLAGPGWATPLPVPTVDATNKNYVSDKFWRGDVWPVPTYQVAAGLAQYGHTALSATIADALVDNAIKVGLCEHYDSKTGAPLGVAKLGMSGAILTGALDGLTTHHKISTHI